MRRAGPGHWKLGLFVLGGLIAGAALLVWVGVQRMSRETERFVTFFDQSVGDLEPGAPIVYRGVPVGRVGRVRIADDGRRIEVWAHLFEEELLRLGMQPGAPPPPDARLKLAMAGITGAGSMELVFVDPAEAPPPALPPAIVPPPQYIPSLPARFTNLGDAVAYVVDEVGPAVQDAHEILTEAKRRVQALDTPAMNEEALATIRSFRHAAEGVETLAGRLSAAEGPLGGAIEHVRSAAERIDRTVAKADVGAATEAVEKAGNSIAQASARFARTAAEVENQLAALRATLDAVRRFVDLLERNPSMLLRGRERPREVGPR
jgi:ABC-type transporter Mla subunit MlaD